MDPNMHITKADLFIVVNNDIRRQNINMAAGNIKRFINFMYEYYPDEMVRRIATNTSSDRYKSWMRSFAQHVEYADLPTEASSKLCLIDGKFCLRKAYYSLRRAGCNVRDSTILSNKIYVLSGSNVKQEFGRYR